MNWKDYRRKRPWPNLMSYDNQSPGRDLNPGSPEYEATALPTQSQRLVK
jgi:hypothetical protein